jgi:hypothetical protein
MLNDSMQEDTDQDSDPATSQDLYAAESGKVPGSCLYNGGFDFGEQARMKI